MRFCAARVLRPKIRWNNEKHPLDANASLHGGFQTPMTAAKSSSKAVAGNWLKLPRRALGLAVLAVAAWYLNQFPFAKTALAAGLACYAILLYRFPSLWLLVIPAALPVVDIGGWSGRFFLEEFDFLIMVTLGILYMRHARTRILPGLITRPYRLPAFLALSYAISVGVALWPLPAIDQNSFSSYLSPYNALRVAKGFFEAWMLFPFLVREINDNAPRAKQLLIAGIVGGLGLAGVAALWERGVFVDLFWGANKYALVQSLLDFTGTYRITGLFSGMNVGDTAIDGYLALATPFSLFFVLYSKNTAVRLLSLAAFGLGSYALLVTFSRGLYAGYALALLIIMTAQILLVRREMEHHWRETAGILIAFAVSTGLLFLLYASGGYQALGLGALAGITSGLLAARLLPINRKILIGLWVVGTTGVIILLVKAIGHSKWSTTSASSAFVLAVIAGPLLTTLPGLAFRSLARDIRPSTAVIGAILLALFWIGSIPPLSGVRVISRFSTSEQDLGTRQSHWQESLNSMTGDWSSRIAGMGVGSYPRYFFSAHMGTMPLASYLFQRDTERSYLELGSGDFNIMQRVPLKPHTTYTLRYDIKVAAPKSRVTFKFCHKHILYSERYVPDCRIITLKPGLTGDWVRQEATLDSGILGRYGIFYWPATMMLQNGSGHRVDVTNISLTDPQGRNLVRNGDFKAGADGWFMVSDFEHLAWHAKNVYLHLFFEQGVLGLIAFLALGVAALFRLLRSHGKGDRTSIFTFASLVSFLVVGLFGTILDMPRAATLIYLVMFMAQMPPTRRHRS